MFNRILVQYFLLKHSNNAKFIPIVTYTWIALETEKNV